MCVVSGFTMISMLKTTVMMRGMPKGTHRDGGSLPCPPSRWSAMLASKTAWYSGVRGGFWAKPRGLVWSHWLPIPGGLRHCPDRSGYLVSSNAAAGDTAIISAAVSATAPAMPLSIAVLPAFPARPAPKNALPPTLLRRKKSGDRGGEARRWHRGRRFAMDGDSGKPVGTAARRRTYTLHRAERKQQ